MNSSNDDSKNPLESSATTNSIDENLLKRVRDLETKHIEQEHRVLTILYNVYRYVLFPNNRDTIEDRDASIKAFFNLLVRWYIYRSVIVAGGGLIAALAVYVAWLEVQSMKKQTSVLIDQNRSLKEQSLFTQESSNAAALSELIKDIESKRQASNVPADSLWRPPRTLASRIASISSTLIPNEEKVTERGDTVALSSERGILLITIADAGIVFERPPRPNFRYADLGSEKAIPLTELNRKDIEGIDYFGAFLPNASLPGLDMEGANFRQAVFTGADFRYADLRGAVFYGSSMFSADMAEADLTNADLRGVRLWGGILRDANLSGAALDSADLRGVDLRGTKGLTSMQLQSASYVFGACVDEHFASELEKEHMEVRKTDSKVIHPSYKCGDYVVIQKHSK